MDSEESFNKLNGLISTIEVNLKKCTKKYKSKHEIEDLYFDLTVSSLVLREFYYFSRTILLLKIF